MKKVPYDVIQKGNLIKLFWLLFLFFNDVKGNLLNLYDNIGFVNKINICPCFVSVGVCVYSHCTAPTGDVQPQNLFKDQCLYCYSGSGRGRGSTHLIHPAMI